MSGFVDVSHMSNEDVRRMGHADDYDEPYTPKQYYRNPYAFRKPSTTIKVTTSYASADVWAAAWQAYAANDNQYLKALSEDKPGMRTNRMLVNELLADTTLITAESRGQGEKMRKYFNGLLFGLVEGRVLSEFMNNAYLISCKETVTGNYDIGIITSLPATYVKSVARADTERKITFARGGYLGEVSDKVEVEIEILKQNWSLKYMTWYVTGITANDNVVFFASKQEMTIGSRVTISGTVKAHRDNDSTQLARVKVVKNV